MELAHLAIAEKAVADGERHIEREERMIADLDRGGHDTKLARTVLETYRRMQVEHIAHRNTLLKMLRQGVSAGAIFRPGHYQDKGQTGADQSPANTEGS